MLISFFKSYFPIQTCANMRLFSAAPKPSKNPETPYLAVDALVLRKQRETNFHDILLVRRKFDPFKGKLAFPGGFVKYNEDPENACLRELFEETKVKGQELKLIGVYGKPGRDPRKHIVTICYRIDVDFEQNVIPGDEVFEAQFFNVCKILKDPTEFAFDHFDILKKHIYSLYPYYIKCVMSL